MIDKSETQVIVEAVRARGWEQITGTVLDMIEPIAPLISQLLWVAQPMARIFNAHDLIGALAETLDNPQGITALRQELDKQ
ncbi:MAG: hypothetical protein ACFE0Q_13485 [Anaerolineae bacterium]